MALDLGRRLTALCAVLAVAGMLACGGGEESSSDTADTGAPVMEKGTREVVLPGTEESPVRALIGTGELPDGYPSDIPPPSDAEPQNAMIIPEQGGLVTFVSGSSRKDVTNHFQSALAEQGWKLEAPSEDEMRTTLKARKGLRKASVTVANGADGGSEIAVTFEGS